MRNHQVCHLEERQDKNDYNVPKTEGILPLWGRCGDGATSLLGQYISIGAKASSARRFHYHLCTVWQILSNKLLI